VRSRCEPSRRALLTAAVGAALWPRAGYAQVSSLARIRERGSLVVGLYQEMPPFHAEGRGIDVELGRALAKVMGLRFSPLPFQAGENMNDDLRNMVWRGHYLGWGPADVLLHVPVERGVSQANPQVVVLAPYYRERVVLAVLREQLGTVRELAELEGRAVAVAGQSMAGWLLAGTVKHGLRTAFASELESVLRGDPRFALQPLPSPRVPPGGWAVGCAIRQGADDLAVALQEAMQALQSNGSLKGLFAAQHVSWHL
jgi:hypothetical protein